MGERRGVYAIFIQIPHIFYFEFKIVTFL